MRILLAGATGATGRLALKAAITAGHEVVALARHPEALSDVTHPRLTVIQGDALRVAPWADAAHDCEGVLSCLGSTTRKRPTTIYSEGTAHLLRALGDGTERRLICLSSAGLETPTTIPLAQRLVTRLVVQRVYRHGFADMVRMEDHVRRQDVRWTIVRAPMLTDKPATGALRSAANSHLEKPTSLPRGDLAQYLVDIVDDRSTWKALVEVSA